MKLAKCFCFVFPPYPLGIQASEFLFYFPTSLTYCLKLVGDSFFLNGPSQRAILDSNWSSPNAQKRLRVCRFYSDFLTKKFGNGAPGDFGFTTGSGRDCCEILLTGVLFSTPSLRI